MWILLANNEDIYKSFIIIEGWRDGAIVGRRTSNQKVAGLTPSWGATT